MKGYLKATLGTLTLAFSVCALMPTQTYAAPKAKTFSAELKTYYTTAELIDILKKEGYAVNDEGKDLILIKIDGGNFLLSNSYDGDIQFKSIFGKDADFTAEKINKLNAKYRYGKYYLDKDGDVYITYLLPADAGLSKQQIIQGLKDFRMVKDSFVKSFQE